MKMAGTWVVSFFWMFVFVFALVFWSVFGGVWCFMLLVPIG